MIIREAHAEDAERIAEVHVRSWRTTYRGIVPDAYLDDLTVEGRAKSWLWTFRNPNEHERIFVAEDRDGRIAGFANGGRNRNGEYRYDGELYAIYLTAEHQRAGIGKALFRRVVESLQAAGCSSMMLWVLESNPSLAFYERMGGRVVGRQTIEIGGSPLTELAVGWERIREIET